MRIRIAHPMERPRISTPPERLMESVPGVNAGPTRKMSRRFRPGAPPGIPRQCGWCKPKSCRACAGCAARFMSAAPSTSYPTTVIPMTSAPLIIAGSIGCIMVGLFVLSSGVDASGLQTSGHGFRAREHLRGSDVLSHREDERCLLDPLEMLVRFHEVSRDGQGPHLAGVFHEDRNLE